MPQQSDQNKYTQLEDRDQHDAQPEDQKPSDVVPQQTVTIALPPQETTRPASEVRRNQRYNTKVGFVTGVLQICVWALLLIFAIFLASFGGGYARYHYWIPNIFPGVLYLVAGILGVVSRNRSTCIIIAYMVLCIVSAVGAGIAILVGGVWIDHVRAYCSWYDQQSEVSSWYYDMYPCRKGEREPIMASMAISLLACIAELIIAIIAAAFCCAGVCGCSTPTQTATVVYAPVVPVGQVYGPVVMVPTPGTIPPPVYQPQGQSPTVVQGQAPA